MADDADRLLAFPLRDPGHNGPVVTEAPVPVHLQEVRGQIIHIVERVRPERVPRDLHALPGREVIKDLLDRFLEFFLGAFDLSGKIDAFVADLAKLVDLFFHFHDRLFKSKARIKNIARAKLDLLLDRDGRFRLFVAAFFLFDLLRHNERVLLG